MSPEPSEEPAPPKRVVRSEDLFGAACEIVILHKGEEYRLRITRSGKLILTK